MELSEDYFCVSQLDFLRVVCSHEHFVALNLPHTNSVISNSTTSSPSPSPSLSSSTSQSSLVSTVIGGFSSLGNLAELSNEFRQQHFLVGLVLSELAAVFELS